MRKLIFLLLAFFACLLLYASPAYAQETDLTTFAVGNRLYENGNFAASADLYQQLVDAGYNDPALFYNLGNAYFAAGEYLQAILNYRRSLALAPRNGDAAHNLAFARGEIGGNPAGQSQASVQLLARLSSWLTLNELAVVLLVLWCIWAMMWLLYVRPKSERQRTGLQSMLIVVALIMGVFVFSGLSRLFAPADAVVMVDDTQIVDAPGSAEVVRALSAGAEVRVFEETPRWVSVGFSNNEPIGWISAEALQPVVIQPEQQP